MRPFYHKAPRSTAWRPAWACRLQHRVVAAVATPHPGETFVRTTFAALAVIAAISAACGAPKKDDGNPTPTPASGNVVISLARGTGSDVDVTIHVTNSAGNAVIGAAPAVTVVGGTK